MKYLYPTLLSAMAVAGCGPEDSNAATPSKNPAAFWDRAYADTVYLYGTRPNDFFREQLATLPPGRVLLPAEGEFFSSSLLVAEPVREALADQVKGDLLAAVPSRMLLAISGTEEPGGIDAFRRFVEDVHRDDSDALSPSVLRWDGRAWAELS